jgi:hypothetical protein
MASPDLDLHALRQRRERRRGRTLTVRYGTLARHLAGGPPAGQRGGSERRTEPSQGAGGLV